MSLNGALQIGRTAIAASQTAMQVVGNNMANAATEGFHRRSIHLSPLSGEPLGNGQFIGRGVQVAAIRREVDAALQSRLRDALSNEHAASIDQRFLGAIEGAQNELTETDLSSLMDQFFAAFSEVANNPEDGGIRAVTIEQGRALAGRLQTLRGDYETVRTELDESLDAQVRRINELLGDIERVNAEVARAEAGQGQANDLRDRRDGLIDELAQHLDVSVIEQPSGSVDILVGSIPILLAGENRGLELRPEPDDADVDFTVRVAADGTTLNVTSGALGGLLRQRRDNLEPAIETLDELAGQIIFQVNRLHSQGQGQAGFGAVEGTYDINDVTANLNADDANLPFDVVNGSFFIHVTAAGSGGRTTHQISVDGDADSLQDLIDRINTVVNVPHVTAGTGVANHFTLTADTGYRISFSDDSSGALAALGVNTFFTGSSAADVDVHAALHGNPQRLAVGAGHVPGSNDTALAIAALRDTPVDELGGASLGQFWRNHLGDFAGRTAAARDAAESTELVRNSIQAQAQAVSGVSLDDETISLLTYQRQFQAAARLIQAVDEMLQTLLAIAP